MSLIAIKQTINHTDGLRYQWSGDDLGGLTVIAETNNVRLVARMGTQVVDFILVAGRKWTTLPNLRFGITEVRFLADPASPTVDPIVSYDVGPQAGDLTTAIAPVTLVDAAGNALLTTVNPLSATLGATDILDTAMVARTSDTDARMVNTQAGDTENSNGNNLLAVGIKAWDGTGNFKLHTAFQDGNSHAAPGALAVAPMFYQGGTSFGNQSSPGVSGASGASVNGMPIVAPYLYNPATPSFEAPRTPNTFKTGSVAANGNTTIWTPAAGKKIRLMGGWMVLTGEAVAAVAAGMDVQFLEGGLGAIGVTGRYYVPAVAVNTPYPVIGFDLKNGKLLSAANAVLIMNLPFALTGGVVNFTVWGTEE